MAAGRVGKIEQMKEKPASAFRVDASSQIGTGHFMRCLTLADAMKQRGVQVCFVCRQLSEHLKGMLLIRGHELVLLDGIRRDMFENSLAHAHWLGVSQEQDAEDTIKRLSGRIWDWIVVDHYALDCRWEKLLRKTAKKVMVIDDIADRKHDCDVLLDQNFYSDMDTRYTDKVPEHCRLLLGPRYALLRDEFRKKREQVKPRNGPVERVFVFFGGVDVENYTKCTIDVLSGLDLSDIHVDVVIGAQHPFREQIESACALYKFSCHVQTDKIAELMAQADLAIGAGGAATWERCCLGLPTLVIGTADNQKRQIADAARDGLIYSPDLTDELIHTMNRHIVAFMENRFLRFAISRKDMKSVDGLGTERVIRKLKLPSMEESFEGLVNVRLAVAEDAMIAWSWRNNEATRRYFFEQSPVGLETHLAWWKRSLSNPQCVLLVGKMGDKDVGVIRYDLINARQAKVSIYLNPEITGLGVGKRLLKVSRDWLLRNHPEIETVIAEILLDNVSSLKAFRAVGFQEQHIVLLWEGN